MGETDKRTADQANLVQESKAAYEQLKEALAEKVARIKLLEREKEIEAALEKVRAKGMAMRKTLELQDVINVVGQQFSSLKVDNSGGVFICINKEIEKEIIVWGSGNTASYVQKVYLPFYDQPIYTELVEAMKKGPMLYEEKFSHAEKIDFFNYLFKNPPYNLTSKEHQKKVLAKKGGYTRACAINKYSSIFMVNHDGRTFSSSDINILSRFGKVFEQSYVRFLDLAKAEAQAKEAQIEAAMERVRGRAMAMRRSDELSEAAELLYNEFIKLGVASYSCGYLINDEEKEQWKIWLTNPGEKFFKEFWTIPYEADHNLKARYESWKRKEAFHCAELRGEENLAHHMVIAEYAPWKGEMTDALPQQLVFNSAHFSLGHLLVISPDRLSAEQEQAMIRFASVFDLTYRRFLDLEKAEEQSRQLEVVFNENQRLLHSILPEPIAEQIRTGQKNVVKRFDEVSILFADIVGFTLLSEKQSAQKVVAILNGLFSKFDDLTDQYGIEKIKTIGDAYMVAAGVPEEKADHAMTIFRFAQDMLRVLDEYNHLVNSQLELRVGISTGPVVAGVIGKKKFAYDLWGDSVNTAARMEAYGQAGSIQISPSSYALLKNEFSFERIADVDIKGKGKMDVYLWRP